MSGKQKKYLEDLLGDDAADGDAASAGASASASPATGSTTGPATGPATSPAPSPEPARARGTTLLGRESALARIASGEVRQVTQLLLDPARVRVWPGNARSYEHLTEESCRELIDSIIAEGGQKVPAVVRRIEGDPDHDYEVIAGTRRHWSISWLRSHSWPDMKFVAQVADLDDEAAFRLADLENRARKDVSDLERARNYADALKTHYDGHLTRMAERLKLSKGWLSKMLKVAALPDTIVAAFSSPAEVQMKPAYPLAQALGDETRAGAIRKEARKLAARQARLREEGEPPLPSQAVISRLMAVGVETPEDDSLMLEGAHGRPAVTVSTVNRHGLTMKLHAGHGLSREELLRRVSDALDTLEFQGRALER